MARLKQRGDAAVTAFVAIAALAIALGVCLMLGLIKLPWISSTSSGPVFAISSITEYEPDGTVSSRTTFDLDERGTVLRETQEHPNNRARRTITIDFECNEYGYPERSTWTSISATDITTFAYKFDAQHRATSVVETDQNGTGSHETYRYRNNATMKSMSFEGAGALSSIAVEYDENGFVTSRETTSFNSDYQESTEHVEYDWSFDDQGNPLSCTVRTSMSRDSRGKSELIDTETYTFECDERGNIVRILNETGGLYKEFEYEPIDDPSVKARIEALRIDPFA